MKSSKLLIYKAQMEWPLLFENAKSLRIFEYLYSNIRLRQSNQIHQIDGWLVRVKYTDP